MNEMNLPIPPQTALPATHIESADLPNWQELPPQYQRELVLALAALLIVQPEVSHEPIA
jgi:hypothetical protein